MFDQEQPSYKVYSQVVLDHRAHIALYFYVRNQAAGNPVATISIQGAALALNRSAKTIYRYLRSAELAGLFHKVRCADEGRGLFVIQFVSLIKVAASSESQNVGSAFVTDTLQPDRLRTSAIRAIALVNQKASIYRAKQASHIKHKKHLKAIDAVKVKQRLETIQSKSEHLQYPKVHSEFTLNGNFLLINQKTSLVVKAGASYLGVAGKANLSVSTIGRHVRRSGLQFGYLRTAYTSETIKGDYYEATETGDDLGNYKVINGVPYLLGCNLYFEDNLVTLVKDTKTQGNLKRLLGLNEEGAREG